MDVLTATATARAGLVGNPSDGYRGAVVAVPVDALVATVEVRDAERLEIVGPDVTGWPSVTALLDDVARFGHEGGRRLVTASIARLARVATAAVDDRPFRLSWNTTIPRCVGLAGSSALVVATLRALARRWRCALAPDDLALLALEVERDELDIPAGLQDRAVQAHGATVLVDTAAEDGRPSITPLRGSRPIPLLVAWDAAAASPSQRYHGDLRARFDAGDPSVTAAMGDLAAAAREAARAVESGDEERLAALVDATWRVRRSLGAVAPAQETLVDAAHHAGMRATSAGSGGSIVAVVDDADRIATFTRHAPSASTTSAST